MLRQTSTVFGIKILRYHHFSTFCCRFSIPSLLFRNHFFFVYCGANFDCNYFYKYRCLSCRINKNRSQELILGAIFHTVFIYQSSSFRRRYSSASSSSRRYSLSSQLYTYSPWSMLKPSLSIFSYSPES